MTLRVWTIGHSTRSGEAFLELLREHGIELLADIRRFPTSRWDQFKQPALRDALAASGIGYVHLLELGGFRSGGYEGHVGTPEFARGLSQLLHLARERRTAIMCAEAVFFRCHRRHVADALVRGGTEVLHIFGPGRVRVHVAQERLRDSGQDGTGRARRSPRRAKR